MIAGSAGSAGSGKIATTLKRCRGAYTGAFSLKFIAGRWCHWLEVHDFSTCGVFSLECYYWRV